MGAPKGENLIGLLYLLNHKTKGFSCLWENEVLTGNTVLVPVILPDPFCQRRPRADPGKAFGIGPPRAVIKPSLFSFFIYFPFCRAKYFLPLVTSGSCTFLVFLVYFLRTLFCVASFQSLSLQRQLVAVAQKVCVLNK